MRKEPLAVSIALHTAVVGSFLLLRIPQQYSNPALIPHPPTFKITKLTLPPSMRARPNLAGGGSRSPLPASKGVAPQRPHEAKLFVPPQLEVRERPRLVLPSGFEDVPKLTGMTGDPSGKGLIPSLGPGEGGSGGPGKYGPGPGPGGQVGGDGKATDLVKKPSRWPQLTYKAEPEYSEPARKARHQGSVLLAVDVGSDGLPRNIRIVRGLGLGLDEKAVDAVATWRFKPALFNGKPVSAPITVEVNFRLL